MLSGESGLKALLAADQGQPELAARSVESSLALARSAADDPLLISLLVRISCHATAIDSLERVLSRGPVSDAELRAPAQAVQQAEDREGLTRALVGETCYGSSVFHSLPSSSGGPGEPSPVVFWLLHASGLWDVEHAAYLKMMGEGIAASGKPLPERFAAFQLEDTGEREDELPWWYFLTRLLASAFDRVAEEDAVHIARVRAARAGLAVERYRLATGELPARLDDLVPEYLDAVPADPIDGKPLRYKKLDKGYVVYSIGPDGTDDGGKKGEEIHAEPGCDVTFTVAR